MAASYPSSVKSFTVRSSGDTIQPAHLNDVQDEIAAIEGGLLNGTAPLASSNATVAHLTASGGAQITGNSTITGTLTVATIVSTSITSAGVTSYVRAYRDSTQTLGSTGNVTVVYNAEVADLLGEWDSTGGVFTPQSSGYYQIHAAVKAGVVSGDPCFRLGLFVNSTLAQMVEESAGIGNMDPRTYQVSGILNLSSGAAGAVTVRAAAPGTSTAVLSSGLSYAFVNIIKLF